MDLETVNATIARIADNVPMPAKPYFVALLGAAENFEIPTYVRYALIAAARVQYREDALLRALATIAFGHPACSDYEAGVGAAWRTLRSAPREPRRTAVQALRGLRDVRRACAVFLPRRSTERRLARLVCRPRAGAIARCRGPSTCPCDAGAKRRGKREFPEKQNMKL